MKLDEAIAKVRAAMEETPSLSGILRDVQSGAVDPEVAAQEILGDENPTFVEAIQNLAGEVVVALEVNEAARKEALDQWGMEEEDLIFQPDPSRPTIMLNPLYQALIAEVLQFDGDVPELRTGHLPEGGTPAVPVQTTARSPILLGAMLKQASEEVHEQLKLADSELRGRLAAVAGRPLESETALARQEKTVEVRQAMNAPAAIPGYGPGQKAALRKVATPNANEMASLSLQEKQTLFHKALTSTQGRRSAAPVLESLILERLHQEGYTGTSVASKGKGSPTYQAEWTISIDGWKGEVNPRFSYIDNAAASLTRQLLEQTKGRVTRFTHLDLVVSCINTVSESRVGWNAYLFDR